MSTKIDTSKLASVLDIRDSASLQLREMLKPFSQTGVSTEIYQRYLSMQMHLTTGVQRYFFSCAAHPDMASRSAFRKFLINFGIEEEPHYKLAMRDLEALGVPPLPPNIDVLLWRSYFGQVTESCPFVRLGATVVLEGITDKAKDVLSEVFSNSKVLTPQNSRFLRVHQHEEMPHGDQIVEELAKANLDEAHLNDLAIGAEIGATIFLRAIRWTLTGRPSI